jgi:MFS family permease
MGNALVADVFFLHEQGTRIALWQLAWVVSVNVTPLISARIITAAGWRNAFYAVLGFACFCAIFFFLAAPESTFIRREISGETPIATEQASNSKEEVAGTTPTVVSEVAAPSRRSPLSVWNGLMTNESIWMAIARPFAVALTPVSMNQSSRAPPDLEARC